MQANRFALRIAGTGMAVLVLLAAGCGTVAATHGDSQKSEQGSTVASLSQMSGKYDPHIDPADFVEKIGNPLFPLKPGTKYEFRTRTGDGVGHETLKVTHDTKKIAGVTTTVVKDVSTLRGKLEEKTTDWYAQDEQGNVWYFGEDTATYKNGHVDSTAGSWKTGADGAKPGIIMNANPRVTDSHRQEYLKGEAEDMYWVVAKNQTIKVPHGTFHNAVLTMEWTPLEPKVVSEKYYVPGIGIVAEKNLSGGLENVELLKVTHNG